MSEILFQKNIKKFENANIYKKINNSRLDE